MQRVVEDKLVASQTPQNVEATATMESANQPSPIPAGLIFVDDKNIWFDHYDGHYISVEMPTIYISLSHNKNKAISERDGIFYLANLADSSIKMFPVPQNDQIRSMTWSPDDSQIFFIMKEENQYAEIYLLDIATGKISNISNSPLRYEVEISHNLSSEAGLYMPSRDLFIASSGTRGKPEVLGAGLRGHCHASFEECTLFPTIFGVHHAQYEVIDFENGMSYLPALTLDGKTLIYDGGVMYNLDTDKKTIFDPADSGLDMMYSPESENPQLVAPILSPDGKKIIWTAHLNNEFYNDMIFQDIETGEAQLALSYDPYIVTATLPPSQRWMVPDISWSPNSEWICIADETWGDNYDEENGENGRIWLISQDGMTVNEISAGDYFYGAPIWNPESTQLIIKKFSYAYKELPSGIYLLDVNTLELIEIDLPESVKLLDWR